MAAPFVFLDDHLSGQSRHYTAPLRIISAYNAAQAKIAFAQIEAALADGFYVAGYAAYELGYVIIDPPHARRPKTNAPLLSFGVFERFDTHSAPHSGSQTPLPALTPAWSEADYLSRYERVIEYIKAGDIYQANLTFALIGQSAAAPDFVYLYERLKARQPVRYGGLIALDGPQILTLSPEQFFAVKDRRATARPMKGTAPRGKSKAEDARIAAAMQADEKSQAENLMIVDLLRNDLSRVSVAGSVKVTDLFTLETYPTLHQMTSGIEAQLQDGVSITDVFTRLFPCGSVTGAPKIRAMEIIHEMEDAPRGPYCGAIGYFDPNGSASFNVAIRTLFSSPKEGGYETRYNVGSGVVIDSVGADEYAECLLKSRIVTDVMRPDFDLIETLRWTPHEGYAALEPHMIRLMRSAQTLGFTLDMIAVMAALDEAVQGQATPQRVRLALSHDGGINVQRANLTPITDPARIVISKNPLTPDVQITAHKVSARRFYDGERARVQAINSCDEVLFVNESGALCEGSFTSLFARKGGQLYTPPLSAGVLPGILRGQMIDSGKAVERDLTPRDLEQAEAIFIGNSLRGLIRAELNSIDPI